MQVLEGIDDFSIENQEAVVHQWIEQKGYKLGARVIRHAMVKVVAG